MTYDLLTYGLEHHRGGTDMPMFVLKSFQEPDLNDIKKQEVGFQILLALSEKLEKHSQAFAVDILMQSTFHTEPYCTCLAPDHFNVIQGWLFQAFSRSRW